MTLIETLNKYDIEIKVLTIGEDEIAVLETDQSLSEADWDSIRQTWDETTDDAKALLMWAGLKVGAVRYEDAKEAGLG